MKYLKHTALLLAPLLLVLPLKAKGEATPDFSGTYNCQPEIAAGLFFDKSTNTWKSGVLELDKGFTIEVKFLRTEETPVTLFYDDPKPADFGKTRRERTTIKNFYEVNISIEEVVDGRLCFSTPAGEVRESQGLFRCGFASSNIIFNLERGRYSGAFDLYTYHRAVSEYEPGEQRPPMTVTAGSCRRVF